MASAEGDREREARRGYQRGGQGDLSEHDECSFLRSVSSIADADSTVPPRWGRRAASMGERVAPAGSFGRGRSAPACRRGSPSEWRDLPANRAAPRFRDWDSRL